MDGRMAEDEMYVNDRGECFCEAHRKEWCSSASTVDFRGMNAHQRGEISVDDICEYGKPYNVWAAQALLKACYLSETPSKRAWPARSSCGP